MDRLPYRYVSLPRLRDLILLLRELGPSSPKTLSELGVRRGLFITERAGIPWKRKSDFYRLTVAAKTLGLVDVEAEDRYVLTPLGAEVASVGQLGDHDLMPCEKALFRRLLFATEPVRQFFLSYFVDEGSHVDPETFRDVANPVRIYPKRWAQELLGHDGWTLVSLWRAPRTLLPIEENAIVKGLRTWCIQADIIGEVVLPAPEVGYLLAYPVRVDSTWGVPQLLGAVRRLFSDHVSVPTVTVHIPRFLFRLCSENGVPLDQAKRVLISLASCHPDGVALQKAAQTSLVPFGSYMSEALRNMYVKYDGVWRSHVTFARRFIQEEAE